MKSRKVLRRNRIRRKIRARILNAGTQLRLSVFRSNKEIYGQIIDDQKGVTLFSLGTSSKEITAQKGTKTEKAKSTGKVLAEKAKTGGVSAVVFDRGGFLYHGRIKAFAEGAREGGLVF
mgnify:CR=1 FL=1